MSGSLATGAGYVLTGLRWLPKSGVRGFIVLPLTINSLLFGGAIWWGIHQIERLSQMLQHWLPIWLTWLHWLLWPLFIVVVVIGVFYAFALVANLIAAPFNGLLAEQVEKMLDSPAAPVPPPSGSGGWRDLVLSPVAGLGRLVYFLLWLIPLIILLFVPVVNVVAPFVWLLSTAWILALEYADYPLGKRGMSFENQRQLLRRHWPLTLGFGGMTLLLTLIPILNFLAMPAAVIGATLMWNRELADGS